MSNVMTWISIYLASDDYLWIDKTKPPSVERPWISIYLASDDYLDQFSSEIGTLLLEIM